MCSSRWVALILVRRTQSLLREDCILGNLSSNPPYNGRWPETNEQLIVFIYSELMDIFCRSPVVYLHLLIHYSFVLPLN